MCWWARSLCSFQSPGVGGLIRRALTGAPPPPARLDSTRRGQTCRVVLVGQMTSRRTGESPRDRAAPAPRASSLTHLSLSESDRQLARRPTHPVARHPEGTRGRRHRHSGQPTRAPTTRAAADPNPTPIRTNRASSTRLFVPPGTHARKRARAAASGAVARGCFPNTSDLPQSPSGFS